MPGGASSNHGADGRRESSVTRGSNIRVGFRRRTTPALTTYNARTLRTDDRIVVLKEEVGQLHWDIVRLSEVRRKGVC